MLKPDVATILRQLLRVPEKLKTVINNAELIRDIAEKYKRSPSLLFIARHYNSPIALEAALKLKELSYIHAEGCPSGELKHGPIALIDKGFPVFTIAVDSIIKDKVVSAIEQVYARGANVIAVITEGSEIPAGVGDVITVPECREDLSIFLTVTVSQLFAYYTAKGLGRDVDKPRNLAKSVTVE
jgi:glucosamine--fructose-6-phosphate aminotransferase (isomerizing)